MTAKPLAQLNDLIDHLKRFIDEFDLTKDSYQPHGDLLPPGDIKEEWHELYSTIQKLERLYETGSPGYWNRGPWEIWNRLLHSSRQDPEDFDSVMEANAAANQLLQRAEQEIASTAESQKGFLDLAVDDSTRTVSNTKQGSVVKIRGDKRWQLFHLLINCGPDGANVKNLINQIWGEAGTRDNIDKLKQRTNNILIDIGVEIDTDMRGTWSLRELT